MAVVAAAVVVVVVMLTVNQPHLLILTPTAIAIVLIPIAPTPIVSPPPLPWISPPARLGIKTKQRNDLG